MSNDDQLQALERLAKLRESGALSEAEFAAQKATILSEAATVHAPLFRRLWFVVLLTCLILTFPLALIILLTGEVYKKAEGARVPISRTVRHVYASILGLWLIAVIVRAILFPDLMKKDWQEGATLHGAAPTTQSQAAQAKEPAQASDQSTGASNQSNSNAQDGSPDMNISVAPPDHGGERVSVTADDDKPFIIQRVVFNDRDNTPDCDIRPIQDPNQEQSLAVAMSTKLPTSALERGQSVHFISICGETLRVTIYTDRGVAHYKLDSDQH